MIYIFDLDHTVVDSSHRQATRPTAPSTLTTGASIQRPP